MEQSICFGFLFIVLSVTFLLDSPLLVQNGESKRDAMSRASLLIIKKKNGSKE